jgi:hypothetical protein
MKRSVAITVLFFGIFVFGLAACGGGGGGGGGSGSAPPSATVPAAPTMGAVTAGNAQATVNFTAPANNGGSAITGYVVTSKPGGITATGTGSPITITGLTNNTAYTFSVAAVNAIGTGSASGNSATVTPYNFPQVNGVAGKIATDGTSFYVVTTRNVPGNQQDVFLTKFDRATGNLLWEALVLTTTDFDECKSIAYMGGYLYLLCVQDAPALSGFSTGVTLIEKLDTATGQQKTEIFNVSGGNSSPLGLTADSAASTLYVCFCAPNDLDWIVRADTSGNILSQTEDNPSGSLGQFSGIMVVGSDGLYSV